MRLKKKIEKKLREIYSGDKRNPKSLSWNIVQDAIKYSIYYTKRELKLQKRGNK